MFLPAALTQLGLRLQLGVKYVDLYLIHHPRLATPDIPTAWAKMEKLKADGLVKSIGVSNFGVAELQILVNSAKVYPAANQVSPSVHPPRNAA